MVKILAYNDRTVTHLHIKWGVAVGPTSSELVLDICPLPGYMPRNQPALAQTYAPVVSGEQMLTVGRGLWTTATDQQAGVSGLRPGRRYQRYQITVYAHSTLPSALWPRRRVVLQRQTQIVCRYSTRHTLGMHSTSSDTSSLCDTKPAPSARYKDGSSGGAASKNKKYNDTQ